MKFNFEKPLMEGLIIKRLNRFIMEVSIDGCVEVCHCPSTGRIGNIVFKNIPCLLSEPEDKSLKRKTKYTVEAISLSEIDSKDKKWIGVNQTKANSYIDFFIKNNCLKSIINCKDNQCLRERSSGNSRLDFFINNDTYLEVKTPLIMLPLKNEYCTNKNIRFEEKTKFTSTDRFIKHIDELSTILKKNKRAIIVTFYMFEADVFIPPKASAENNGLINKISRSVDSGVEFWQVNAKFDREGVKIADYYRMEI